MVSTDRPIGYWLKHLDRLIEATFDHTLADEALERRDWQVMNALQTGPLEATGLADALRPFWGEGAVTLVVVLGRLRGRGWIEDDARGRLALTAAGVAAHTDVAARVQATRRRMLDGLTAEQYRATVEVLGRMAENLEGGVAA